jgi:hypothetical protein
MFNLFKFKDVTRALPESLSVARPIPEDATLEQLRDEMRELLTQEELNHFRLGQIYNYIVAKKLAEKAGYKDAKDYLTKNLAELSQSALTMYGTVAESFSEPVARLFGVTCLSLLLVYTEAADVALNHDEPGPTPIEVPDDKGHVTVQPFSSCNVEQLRKALLRKRKPASSKPLPPEAEALADRYSLAVAVQFPNGKGTRVKVLLRNEKGKPVLDFKSIPLDQVTKLGAAISTEPPQAPEVPPKQ